jgi:mono/diheme cytochrome c family protein
VVIAGHLGAELTHGEDYLSELLPSQEAGEQPISELSGFSLASMKGPLNEEQIQDLNLQVRTIFAHNCYSCHGAGKVKGQLRLDRKEFIFEGGEHGKVIVPGNAANSEMIRRIKLPRNDKESMPTKGKGLTKNEIAIIEFWIQQGAPWPAGAMKSLYRVAALQPRLPELPQASGIYSGSIDRFVNKYFTDKKISWGKPVDDRIYIRRVYLDAIGLIPPADSVDAFIADNSRGKRERLVRKLLARNHDYAQHWSSFWNDLLRNDYTGTGYITGGRFNISTWLYNSLLENKPYDLFVKQLVSPEPESQGFIRGIQWRGSINSSQSTEMQAAQNVSQVFLGLNLKCASCHDSFISDWKLEDAYAFANLFSDSLLEINKCDKPTGKMAGKRILYPELGTIDSGLNRKERLVQLADKLVQPNDGRLYRTIVNRVWAQLFGRGMVEPVDAMDNEPWSQDLLDWLAHDFVNKGHNILPPTVKENLPFTRASLIRNNPFLLALGRPSRETVTTSRTSQANLIQALELTNGYTFNQGMKRAAEKWRLTYPDPEPLVTALYRNMLGRKPNNEEKTIAVKALGPKPDTSQVQDLIWAMTVHPEFQLIY